MKKIILIAFLCLALCVCFVSCNNSDNPDGPQAGVGDGTSDNTEGGDTAGPDNSHDGPQTGVGDGSSDNTEGGNTAGPDNSHDGPQTGDEDVFVDYTKETDTPYVDISYDMSLIADLYLSIEGAWDPAKMYIDVIDGQLYINEVLFDQVTYEENVEVKYADKHMCIIPAINVEYNNGISGTEEEIELLTLMTRIAQQKNCYLLKSSVDNDFAEYIAAYHIDDVCYIVLFDEEGTVLCIYYMEIEYAEPVLTDGMIIELVWFAMWEGLSSPGGGKISVIDNEIYGGTAVFKLKYYNGLKINTEWCKENVNFNINREEGIDLLERLNEEKGCFVMYRVDGYNEELAIYVIDGVYYFIDDIENRYRSAVWISRMYYGVEEK